MQHLIFRQAMMGYSPAHAFKQLQICGAYDNDYCPDGVNRLLRVILGHCLNNLITKKIDGDFIHLLEGYCPETNCADYVDLHLSNVHELKATIFTVNMKNKNNGYYVAYSAGVRPEWSDDIISQPEQYSFRRDSEYIRDRTTAKKLAFAASFRHLERDYFVINGYGTVLYAIVHEDSPFFSEEVYNKQKQQYLNNILIRSHGYLFIGDCTI